MARALGKGLDALIAPASKSNEEVKTAPSTGKNTVDETAKGNFLKVKLTLIEPNPEQPRRHFNEDKLVELAESIKQHGVLEPITLNDKGNGHYEIVAGERRWRASRMAGLKEIPATIGKFTRQQIAEISLIENIQRDDLNPIEEAQAYKRLMTEFEMKQDEVAEKVSKSRSTITNSLRLLKLCDKVQQMVIDDTISTGHARALLAVDDPNLQFDLATRVLDEKLSVREIEKIVKDLGKTHKKKKSESNSKELDVFYKDLSEKLKNSLGTKVSISGKGDGAGKIEIEFYSNEELDRLIAKIK